MDITEVVRVVMEQIKEAVRSETVIGTPVESAGAVIIPRGVWVRRGRWRAG